MASSLPPPPTDYDLSDNFAPVDKRNIGGQGCFNAGVYVVKSKRSGNKYVEKKFSPKNIDDGSAEFEMFVLRELRHKNIVKYICGFVDEHTHGQPTASIYLEYCDIGNLRNFMKEKFAAGRPLNEGPVWNLFMQLANAVSYMQFGVRDACRDTGVPHGWIGVVHRDIKLDNIFLCSIPDTNGIRLVLGDFGQAIREDDDGNWGRQYLGGNQATAPPEVDMYGIEAYSYQGDVWAVGCCMSAICRMTSEERFIGDAGPTYSQSLNRAIRRLLQLDPSRRPAMWVFARNMPGWRQQGLSEGPGRRPTW